MKCVEFSYGASSPYVDLGASANLNIVGALSIDAWIKFVTNPSLGRAIIFLKAAAAGYSFSINSAVAGRYHLSLTKSGVIDIDSALAKIEPNKKHHVAVTWDGVNSVKFYVDGVLMDTKVDANAIAGGAGTSYLGHVNLASTFKGCVFAVNVYNRLLTAAEILYNKEHPNNPIKRGRQLSLTQESLFGGVWTDLSPNAYNGTLTNTRLNVHNNLAGRNASV
jgi:hypothetical protein